MTLDIERYLDQAEDYLSKGDLDQALGFYRSAINDIERGSEPSGAYSNRIKDGLKRARGMGINLRNDSAYSSSLDLGDRLLLLDLDIGELTDRARDTIGRYGEQLMPWMAAGLDFVYRGDKNKLQEVLDLLNEPEPLGAMERGKGRVGRGSVMTYICTIANFGADVGLGIARVMNKIPEDCIEDFLRIDGELEIRARDDYSEGGHERLLRMLQRLLSDKAVGLIETKKWATTAGITRLAFYIDDERLFDEVLDHIREMGPEDQKAALNDLYDIAVSHGDKEVEDYLTGSAPKSQGYPKTKAEIREIFRPIEARRMELCRKSRAGLTEEEHEELAVIEFKRGNSATAIDFYKDRFGKDSMLPPERLVEIGEFHASLGGLELAEKAYKLALGQTPPNDVKDEINRKMRYMWDRGRFLSKDRKKITKKEAQELFRQWKTLQDKALETGIIDQETYDRLMNPRKSDEHTGSQDGDFEAFYKMIFPEE